MNRTSVIVVLIAILISACTPATPPPPTATTVPTGTPTPAATPTPAPSPTPTPPPSGIVAEKQPDGSTRVIDYDNGYQFSLGSDWQVFVAGPGGWASTSMDVPQALAEAKYLKSQAEKADPGTYRLAAVDFAPEYVAAGHFPMIDAVVAPSSPISCMPPDYRVMRDVQALKAAGTTSTSGFGRNDHSVEIATFQPTGAYALDPYQAHLDAALFDTAAGSMAIELAVPQEFSSQAASALDSLTATIELLPSKAEAANGMELVPRADGTTLVIDGQAGYQFELDESWRPIVVTQNNATCLSEWVIAPGTQTFSPDVFRLVVLTHQPKYVAQWLAQGYAVHLAVGIYPDFTEGTSMSAFLASQAKSLNGVALPVTTNANGLEIGTLEVTSTQTETQVTSSGDYVFTHISVRGVIAHFKVGHQMMWIAFDAPSPYAKDLLPAFESIVSSIKVQGP